MKATKVRIYPTNQQIVQLSKNFGATRWLWNQSLFVMSQTYKETGKGVSAYDMKKQIPKLKKEYKWLKDTYSQCLQQSVLNLSQAFQNFLEGRAKYPTFKSKFDRQSVQYPANVKIEGDDAIRFPGNLGMALCVRSFDCPHCGQKHDLDVNAAINIKNEGLRLLALGISAIANRGSVNPKGSGRKKSTNSEVTPLEIGSPHHRCISA